MAEEFEDLLSINSITDALKKDLANPDNKKDFLKGEPFYYILNNGIAIVSMKGSTLSFEIVGAEKLDVTAPLLGEVKEAKHMSEVNENNKGLK